MFSLTSFSPFPLLPLSRHCANAASQSLCSSSGWGVPDVPFIQQKAMAQHNSCAKYRLIGDECPGRAHTREGFEDGDRPASQDDIEKGGSPNAQ